MPDAAVDDGQDAQAVETSGRTLAPRADSLGGIADDLATAFSSFDSVAIEGDQVTLTAEVDAMVGSLTARPTWESLLFAGALRDQAIELDGNDRTLVILNLVPKGGGDVNEFSAGVVRTSPGKRYEELTTEKATELVSAGAQELGLQLDRIELVPVIDNAVAVYLTASDPKVAIDNFSLSAKGLWTLMGGDPKRFEGLYVEIRDKEGSAITVSLLGSRADGGGGWSRPGFGGYRDDAGVPPPSPPTESVEAG